MRSLGKLRREAGLSPIRLGAKEGLAMINGTQFITSLGSGRAGYFTNAQVTRNLFRSDHFLEMCGFMGRYMFFGENISIWYVL